MGTSSQSAIQDARVSVTRLLSPVYPTIDGENEILRAIRRNSENLGWADARRGAFGQIIQTGSRVLIKPNWVLHANQGTGGLQPLITHQSIIKATVTEVLKADPGQVIVGDSPIQSCDFSELLRLTGLDEWSRELQQEDTRFKGIRDFRRTTCVFVGGIRVANEERFPEDEFILYNLGKNSLLEPLTDGTDSFRVTCYDPRLLAKTHSPSNHQYLVAKEIIEADVVVNLPKLKTHKKAGITSALKNLVGINGNKEYLPHHRTGGTNDGGDCYPGRDLVKRSLESILDRQNMTRSRVNGKMLRTIGSQLERWLRLKGDEIGVEGAWSGNETVARMTLDLNRILLYGKPDGKMDEKTQRRVVHLVDAVIAGQGDGPLASDDLPLGLILAGGNASAVDWVGAGLLGYDAERIPLIRHSIDRFQWQIADFAWNEIDLLGDFMENMTHENLIEFGKRLNTRHPAGWSDLAA